jgi:uncharacterized membrane protein YtjA (UPF0391 family)
MHWLRTIVRETVGLFVDDGSFAIVIAAWLGFSGVVLPHVAASNGWRCGILFSGLGLILFESSLRHARRRRGT